MKNVEQRCTCGCTTVRFYPAENQWEPDCWDCWEQAREYRMNQDCEDDLPF